MAKSTSGGTIDSGLAEIASLTLQETEQNVTQRRGGIQGLDRSSERQVFIFQQSLSPGERLPPELLAKIFVCCVSWPTPSEPWVDEPTSSRIKLSHVCRHWRDVALNTSELWSFINFDETQPAKEFLVRSKAFPISAQMTLYPDPRPPPAPFLGYLSRTAMLSFHADDFKALYRAQRTSAPHLNTLSITVSHVAAWNSDSSILATFLGKLVDPPLRHLKITNWMIPWNHPIFRSTITTLVLELERSYVGDREVLLHEWDQMLDTLGNMQSLETLSLQHIASPSPSPTIHSIVLPRLCSLKLLSSPATSCGLFLAHCCSPSIAHLPFDFRPVADDRSFESLSISGRFSLDTTWDLSITQNTEKYLVYRFTGTDEDSKGADKPPSIDITVRNRFAPLFDLSDFGISISGVELLRVGGIPPNTKVQEEWIVFAEDLPNLKTLVVQGESAAGLLPLVLYHDPAIHIWETIDPPQTALSFPHLRTLVLERLNLDFIQEGYVALQDALQKRKDNGLRLEKLRFIEVDNLPADEPRRLAELLGCEVDVSPKI